MNIENKTPAEIQQQIFDEIKNGADADALKNSLKAQGVITEGYYFTSETQRKAILEEPKTASSHITTKQIVWGVITLLILCFRVARCAHRM